MKIKDIYIDTKKMQVLVGLIPLDLSPTEYHLLLRLVQAQGQVVTFEDLAHAIHNTPFDRSTARRMLSAHISNLRHKLREINTHEYISNQWGVGYFISDSNSNDPFECIESVNSDIIGSMDSTGVINYISYSISQLGYSADMFLNTSLHSWMNLFHPNDFENARTHIRKIINREITTHRGNFRLLHQNGSYLWFEIQTDVTRNNQDIMFVARRIIEDEETQMQRMAYHFINAISHDLRTPLSIIGTSTYLIRRKTDAPVEIERYLQNIEMQVQHLTDNLEAMLNLSHLKENNFQEDMVEVNLNDLTAQIVSRIRPLAEFKKQTLTAFHEVNCISTMGIEHKLGEAIEHVVTNAINYTSEGGEICVYLKKRESYAVIEVVDDGMGIAPKDINRIFTPFFRVDAARSLNTGGMGLGLSIMKAIIEMHKGDITVKSSLGQGSTFCISLPFTG